MGPRVTAEAQRLLDSIACRVASRIYDEATTYADEETGRIGLGFWMDPPAGEEGRYALAAGKLLDAGLIRLEQSIYDPRLQNAWACHLEPESLRRQAYQFGELTGRVFDATKIKAGFSPERPWLTSAELGQILGIKKTKLITEARRNLLRSLIWPDLLHCGSFLGVSL